MARINLGKVVPEKGIDYFTDAEVEEIKNEIKTEIDAQGMAQAITELQLGSGHSVELTLDPQTYQIVLVLKNAAGTALSTQTIDLPNENAITNLAYNNGVLTVTKQSGATSQINLTGLIEGLVTENDFNTFKEALQTTLEAINEKDAEQDEAIAENYKVINKLNEKVANQQKVIDQLPQVTGQGTEVTLENTIEAPFTKFDVEGNSEQESTKGYQLLNPADFSDSLTNNGITFTNNGDGSITINGTSTGTAMLQLDKIKKTLKAGKYTFSLTNGIKDKLYMIWSAPYNSTNTIGTDMLYKEVTFDSDTELTYIYIQIPSGHTFNNVVVYPMIYEGSYDSSKPWEKYTGGQATPNPNYEQPIYSAGDNENIIDINRTLGTPSNTGYDNTNKRTFDVTTLIKFLTANNYYNAVVQIDYSLIDNGIKITTKQAGYGIGFPVILSSAKTYTISANIDVIDNQMIRAIFYKEDGTYISNVTSSGTNKFLTFTTTDDTYFVVIMLTPKANVETTYSEIKLEKGNKATPWSPYGMGSINEQIQTRNVVPNNAISQIKNGVELIKNEDGSFTLNGTASANFDITFATNFTLKAGVYTSSIKQQIKKGLYYSFDNIADTMLNGNSGKRKTTFTLNADKTYSRAFLWIDNGTTFNNETYFIQTEPGSTESSYVPYKEQDYSIFVQQPFRSIGDVRDIFFKNTVDSPYYDENLTLNGWYERHLPYIASYNGEILPQDVYNEVDNVKYCNEKSMSTTGQFSIGASVQYIDENNWNDLPCTETQIQQLENKPSTYKDFTIINSEDETPAYLEVSGIYDMNKLITRVEVIESES